MITAAEIPMMSKVEKLSLMELLWTDLAALPDELDSPKWHQAELSKTSAKVEAGEEAPVDWSEAKNTLRNERK
ncbi:MAG: addiction module protein [Methylococcales bacterium]|nr:addiction module protein [Methylococcales bacterium]